MGQPSSYTQIYILILFKSVSSFDRVVDISRGVSNVFSCDNLRTCTAKNIYKELLAHQPWLNHMTLWSTEGRESHDIMIHRRTWITWHYDPQNDVNHMTLWSTEGRESHDIMINRRTFLTSNYNTFCHNIKLIKAQSKFSLLV